MATQTTCTPLHPRLHCWYTLLLSMHSHFNNSTYMYILPQLPRHRCPRTLTLYQYPLYIASTLLFYCSSLIICYFYLLFFFRYFLNCIVSEMLAYKSLTKVYYLNTTPAVFSACDKYNLIRYGQNIIEALFLTKYCNCDLD